MPAASRRLPSRVIESSFSGDVGSRPRVLSINNVVQLDWARPAMDSACSLPQVWIEPQFIVLKGTREGAPA